jgi:hypothetical protein
MPQFTNDPQRYIHPIIEAYLASQQLQQRKIEHSARQEQEALDRQERAKQFDSNLKLSEKNYELNKKAKDLQEKAAIAQEAARIRQEIATGIRAPQTVNAGNGPLDTQLNSYLDENNPLGPVAVEGVRTPQDLRILEQQKQAGMNPILADRAGQAENARVTARMPLIEKQAETQLELANRKAVADVLKLGQQHQNKLSEIEAKAKADKAIAAFRESNANSRAQLRASVAGTQLSPRVVSMANAHDNNKFTQAYEQVLTTYSFIKSLPNDTRSPTNDQARFYAFAQTMDPGYSVREGEYKTVQEYSQALFDKLKIKVNRVFNNDGLLTPEAVSLMENTIGQKLKAQKQMYEGYRKTIATRIDLAGGKQGLGESVLGRADSEIQLPAEPTKPRLKTKMVNGKLVLETKTVDGKSEK